MQPSNMQTVRATVRGRVQGVGFRMFVRDCAERLGLAGYVHNQPDGSVYVEATGSRSALDQFLVSLRRGPSMARVEDLATEWVGNVSAGSGSFEVRG